MEDTASNPGSDPLYSRAKASKFTFKSKSDRPSKRHRRTEDDVSEETSSKRSRSERDGHSRREKQESRRHRHKRHSSHPDDDRHPTSTRDGAYYDPNYRHRESLFDGIDGDNVSSPGLAPDDAFRESLFDALADDEGAAYWEGVYGQPVHVYPDTKKGPDGKLERMSEEEYADYVRTKMWEKSHQHILEEREAKEKARQERKKQRQHADKHVLQEEKEREHIRQQMEESLRRGAERKKAKEAAAAWEQYSAKWEALKNTPNIAQEAASKVAGLIPWPVLSGGAKHISKEQIERFLRASPAWKDDATALLKMERVRWHPDKMQQRFGQHIDVDTMKSVTAVFQVVDRLWNERR